MKINNKPIPLKEQVVSLEVARELNEKLKSVGIELKANFFWLKDLECLQSLESRELLDVFYEEKDFISTRTLTEVLALLPKVLWEDGESYMWLLWDSAINYIGHKDNKEVPLSRKSGQCINKKTNPATAAAQLFIWCIDKGYVKGDSDTVRRKHETVL